MIVEIRIMALQSLSLEQAKRAEGCRNAAKKMEPSPSAGTAGAATGPRPCKKRNMRTGLQQMLEYPPWILPTFALS